MKNNVAFFTLLIVLIASCSKPAQITTCPVYYSVDSTTHMLQQTWDFVGFVDTLANTTGPPLCSNSSPNIVFYNVPDSLLTAPYNMYPYHFSGSILINSYDGTYKLIDSTHIAFSQTINSTVKGTMDVSQFEQRYHNLLTSTNTYKINHNVLTLIPDTGAVVLRYKAE